MHAQLTSVRAPFLGAQRPLAASRRARHVAPARRGVAVRASWSENLINSITVAINKSPLAQGKAALAVAQAGDYDVDATLATINNAISSDGVVVFSWSRCPFCLKAKALLDDVGAKYVAYELDERADGKAIRAELAKMTGRTSVPNVFIQGKSYGGCNDGPGVMTLQKEGKLKPLLQAAGAL